MQVLVKIYERYISTKMLTQKATEQKIRITRFVRALRALLADS